MPAASSLSLQDISWNGVYFQVPDIWEPVAVFTNYLLFEENYQPVLELKWQQIRGSFSVERILKQLRRSGSKKDSIEPQPVPLQWQQILQPFNCYCFTWQGETNSGFGLLRHCPTCNLTILLQFYTDSPQKDPACLHFLQTLRCHRQTDNQVWAIFDIEFSLPGDAVLLSQEFHTGRYAINFSRGNLLFSLLRFKPAKVLLNDNGLTGFGRRLLCHGEQLLPGSTEDTASWKKQGNSWLRFRAKLRRRQADHFLQLHSIAEKNVILGVQAQSNQTIDSRIMQTILNSYHPR